VGAIGTGSVASVDPTHRSSTPIDGAPPSGAPAPEFTTSTAWASLIWWPASSWVKFGLIGVAAAPRCHAAKIASTSSLRFGNITATTSPLLTPLSRNWAAMAETRPSRSRNVSSLRSSRIAGASP
jgi:hypothetical protein